MKCIVCNNELHNNKCANCGFIIEKENNNIFKKIFTKNISKESFSVELENVINFFKWKLEIFSKDEYINRRSIIEYYNKEKDNFTFFNKMKKSKDLNSYCKKYNFSVENIEMYIYEYENLFTILKERNNEFVRNKIIQEEKYFDTILKDCDNKIMLDEEQRIAIVTDEDYNIVIAGAGAGKTTTVAAKVKYLVDKVGIAPEDILLISFTNKAVKELKERINDQLGIPCPIATFHSAGRAIILKDTDSANTQIERENYYIINKYLTNKVLEDKELLAKIVMLYGYYLDLPDEMLDKLTKEEFFDYKERKDYTTLKSNLQEVNQTVINARTKEQKTIKNEVLRSNEEVQIANFLYLHNLDYEYEKPYKFKIPNSKKIYTPDFYITQGDKIFYLEHFGVSESLQNNRYTKEELEEYIINMKYKIAHHQMFGTNLIKTYSKYNDGRTLLEHLEEELVKAGFVLTKRPDEEVYDKILRLDQEKYIIRFSMLASRFIHLFKTKDYHQEDFLRFKTSTKNPRSLLFFDVLESVYLYYQNYLKERHAVDFEDMINESARLLREAKQVQKQINFKYVIVDEYQDISRQRFNLVKEINNVCNAKICVVGDDWQSIYAFSGSELKLFTDYEKEFGYAEVLKITKTYRNSQELIDIAGNFIQKNKSQITKQLKSNKTIRKPVVVFTYSDDTKKNEKQGLKGIDYEKAKLLEEVLEKLIQVDGKKQNILLIGRYNFDGDHLCRTGLFYLKDKTNQVVSVKYPFLNLTFLTAHSSKGLTFDNVIIINAVNAKFGFPSQIEDDPVLMHVINNDKSYEFAEERRLFYVALTRTKNRVFILAPINRPSKFVLELINDYEEITVHGEISKEEKDIHKDRKKCPKCGYPLQLKENKAYGLKLYICTNEPELCDFITNDMRAPGNIYLCDKCDGYMIVKRNKNFSHYFMGCTNYKHDGKGCNHIEQIEDFKKDNN